MTLGPAIISVASRFGKTLEPKRAMRTRGWRKVGAMVVRWPGPILVATIALSLIGLLTLPGYKTNYNDRNYLPTDLPANVGYAAADRHFSPARMNPELLMVESDHDLRNSADFLVIDKIAKAIFRVDGIARVQAITRPDGKPIEHTSIPFQISMQGTTQQLNQKYMQDRMADMLMQADEMQNTIDTMTKMSDLTAQMADITHNMVDQDEGHGRRHRRTARQHRRLRRLLPADPQLLLLGTALLRHPGVLVDLRSIFDTLDGIDVMTDDIQQLVPELERLDALMPQLVALMPEMITTMKTMKHDDADDVSVAEGHAGSDGGDAGELDGHGRGVRRVDERRLVLSAAGDLRQPRLQARHEAVHLARRSRGALHHLPRGRSR